MIGREIKYVGHGDDEPKAEEGERLRAEADAAEAVHEYAPLTAPITAPIKPFQLADWRFFYSPTPPLCVLLLTCPARRLSPRLQCSVSC